SDVSSRQSYDLARTFHRRQNFYTMQQFLPISTVFTVTFLIFYVSVFFSEALKSNMSAAWYLFTSIMANVVPYYCFLCPLIFLVLIRRGHFQ
ncbi:hypothetical protein PMAYCL1PPCAC_10459, partial [Pristionchus mayeri]